VNNVVVDDRGHLKILDYGCGRSSSPMAGAAMTPDLMVPFYRPPEVFLGISNYDIKGFRNMRLILFKLCHKLYFH
jgi:serine/threonine protein kinase